MTDASLRAGGPVGGVRAATSAQAVTTEVPRGRPPAWWGMVLFIATEVTLFACLFAAYFYLRFSGEGPWPPHGIAEPTLEVPLMMTGLRLVSAVPTVLADRAARRDRRGQLVAGLTLTWLCGAAFLGLQASDFQTKLADFQMSTDAYGSLYYTISGLDAMHVFAGIAMVGFTVVVALAGRFRAERVRLVALYWYFVVGIWVLTFSTLDLSPLLMR